MNTFTMMFIYLNLLFLQIDYNSLLLCSKYDKNKAIKNFPQDFRFLRLLVDFDFMRGLGESYHASDLLYWSLQKTEALKFVVSVIQKYYLQFELNCYQRYGSSPIWAAIMKTENGSKKLKVRRFLIASFK
jgi:hypothetical protein